MGKGSLLGGLDSGIVREKIGYFGEPATENWGALRNIGRPEPGCSSKERQIEMWTRRTFFWGGVYDFWVMDTDVGDSRRGDRDRGRLS